MQDITLKWEKLRNKQTTAAQKAEIVHEIMQQVQHTAKCHLVIFAIAPSALLR